MAELIPAPFPSLVRRLFREFEREGKVYDLPARRFWHGPADLDTSVLFHGRRAANPVGPAAGPQDQMAQNIVLAWLAGSRILELKTVQINDRLTIPRPCIDATTVGYNVEWSQELRLADSLREYVAGSMLLDMVKEVNLLGRPSDLERDDTILDMSVGYDLAGIRSPEVRGWIDAMKDARLYVEALRRQIPADFRQFRDLDFTTCLSDQITLSTFHGCPADEIEGIVRFLLTEMDVHVTVKLNPTLLGRDAVDGLLHDVLGYTEIETRPEDFAKDLQWEQALEITDRLSELARSVGRTFQVKFSNTLVVKNHRSFFPQSEAVMYLSGEPLHVVTLNLLEKYRRARPEVPISFSAGVDGRNFPDCAAMGFTPITTCTDLLRPGGYARLPKYLENLEERMRALGVRRLGDYVVKACGQGEAAVAAVAGEGPAREALSAALKAERGDLRAALEATGRPELYDPLVQAAALLNTPVLVAKATAEPRYRAEANRKEPRKIGSRLWLFDCINCDKCVPVCPNDANFVYETGVLRTEYPAFRVSAGAVVVEAAGLFEVKKDAPDRELPGLLQRVRELRHLLPRGRRPLRREAAVLRVAGRLAGPSGPRRLLLPAPGRRGRGLGTHPRAGVPSRGGPRARPRPVHRRRHPGGGAPLASGGRSRPAPAPTRRRAIRSTSRPTSTWPWPWTACSTSVWPTPSTRLSCRLATPWSPTTTSWMRPSRSRAWPGARPS